MSTKRRDRHAANTVALERNRQRKTKLIDTLENWRPSWPGKQVLVSCIPFIGSPYGWRVCAWGADDFGLEKDFPNVDKQDALRLYEQITNGTTQAQMREWGMVNA